MLENIQKMIISKPFLISLLFICLMFTSLGVDINQAYAVELNESGEIGLDVDVGDKLENSHENGILENTNENKLMLEYTGQNDVLQAKSHSLDGGTFGDIQKVINSASSGDTIKLSGNFISTGGDTISLSKKLTFTSSSQATFDGKNKTVIFKITSGGAQSTFKNLKFINGYTDNRGGAISLSAKFVTFDNCVFENNYAKLTSGAIQTPYKAETSLGLTIKNCNFTKNGAGIAAGAVGAFSHDFKITNCIFDSNYIKGPEAVCGGAVQIGLDTEPSYGVVRDCIFKNNIVITSDGSGHAGAGCVRNGSSYYNCVFINNTADHGGALTYHASGNLNNCTLINNTANVFGGAVSILLDYQDFMDLNITNSVFKGNKAPLGGAVKLDGFNIKIEKSTFDDNYASRYGGAVNIEANNVKIINSDFNRNIANIDGGAVFIKGEDTTVKNSKFIANEAIPDVTKLDDGLGGAIYINSTKALAQNNVFKLNTARNGSAIYFDKHGVEFKLKNNTLYQNQAWVYHLPISAHDIYYGDVENIQSVIIGGNNIADYDNLDVSNAIYNAANFDKIEIDGENPVSGATNSGKLYQDDREYNMEILMTVKHEDGTVVYNDTLNSDYLGEVSDNLTNLKPGKYYVTAKHFEDNYYKAITNSTVFNVLPKIDNKILKSINKNAISYEDMVVWTLNITNNGPNDATGVVVNDVLPKGLIWVSDDTNGAYNPKTGVLKIGPLKVGETLIVNIVTIVNKTGNITNKANVTGNEFDIDLNNNHDEKQISIPPAVDVGVVKPRFGDLVEWTLVVSNYGPDVAHDVKVSDVLPKGLIFVNSTGNYDADTGIWKIGTLGINKSVKLNIITKVDSTGLIKNNASVSSKEFDYNLTNNFDESSIKADPAVDVGVVPRFGDLVEWTLVVSNYGPDVAHDVKVSDVLPKGVVFVNSTGNYDNKTGIWKIGTLGVNKSVKLCITCKINATGTISNNADATSREFDYNLDNNHARKSVKVDPAVDVGVVKGVNVSNPRFGDLVEWNLVVSNYGPDVAHDVKVSDVLPKSLILVNSTGNYDKDAGIWKIGTLGIDKSVKLSLICKVNKTGRITNGVNVTSREFDYDMDNNHDNETINVGLSTDLAILKLANVSTANYGDTVEWTLLITNNGPNNATNVKVMDVLPNGFVHVKSTMQRGSYSQNVFNVGKLNVGETLKLTIISKVIKTGNFINFANITGKEFDYNLDNNEANKSIFINPAVDLEVKKSVNDTNPDFKKQVKWTLTVKNNGPDDAHNVKLADKLPKSLIWVSDDSLGKYDPITGIWDIGTLKNGKSVKLSIVSQVDQTGNITNNVSVTSKEFDYNPANNFDNETIAVNVSGDLVILKTANVSEVNYGELVKWTLTALNNGPDKVNGIVVEDMLPEGLVLINYTASKGFYDDAVWNLCCLEKGEIQTLDLICKVNKTGHIINLAKISGIEYDPVLDNNVDNESIFVPSASDVAVLKQVNDKNPFFGDIVTWMIQVTNNGPDNASNVVVCDELPEGLLFKDYTSSRGSYENGIWHLDYLNVGDSEYLNISCYVNELGVIANNVSATANEFDINMSNNYDNESIDVLPVADLSIEKVANVSVANYNDFVKWTLTVSNQGFNDATGVFVEDVLPDSLKFIEASGDGNYEAGIWYIGDLNVGDYKELEIVSKVIDTGDIINMATVQGNEEDPNLDNNEAEDDVHVYPAADLSIIKSVSKYQYYVGDLVTYSIKVSNDGPDVAKNVKVNEDFPKSLLLKSFKATKGTFDSSIQQWSIDELAAGCEENLLVEFEAINDGIFKNVASVLSDTFDYDLSNNDDFAFVNVIKSPTDHSNRVIKNISTNLFGHKLVNAKNIHHPASNIQKKPTANLIALLVVSTLVSIIFCGSDIFKRR
ncbi:hypothetical protein [uncultured Methanobrevibacter sp.]|uniref:hypothetical protein n=1 Tax=uncultured Methanobrevibacter sp. TaxID=253161 RepID=UPI0025DF13C2|nr:hypothetical protein [uncultured Methanobrevibacter sp.]